MKWPSLPQSIPFGAIMYIFNKQKNDFFRLILIKFWMNEWMNEGANEQTTEWMNYVVFDLPGNCLWYLSIDNTIMIPDSIFNHLCRCVSHFYAILVSLLLHFIDNAISFCFHLIRTTINVFAPRFDSIHFTSITQNALISKISDKFVRLIQNHCKCAARQLYSKFCFF